MSDDIDFSNAGLGIGEADASNTDVTDEVEAVEPDAAVAETPDDAENLAAVEDAAPEADAEESDPYEARYSEAQKLIGRQGQELGDLRKQLEAFMSQQQAAPEPEPDAFGAFEEYRPSSPQELIELSADPDNAEWAFQFAATQAPEYLPHVLAEVQMYDPATAERMRMEYYAYVAQQSVAPVQQSYQAQQAHEQSAGAVNTFAQSVENWDDIRGEVAQVIEDEPWLVGDGSPDAVQRGLRAAVRMVQQARDVATTHAQAQVQSQGQAIRRDAVVETGTAGAAPAVEAPNPSQDIANAIFAEDERIRGLL